MRLPRAVWILVLLALPALLRSQNLPLAQEFVANIGATPLKAPATADFAPATAFTMEGWFYLARPQPSPWLMGKHFAASTAGFSFALMLNDTDTKPRFLVSAGAAGNTRGIVAPSAIPLRTWTHLAAVYENGAMRLLVNGVVVATGTGAGPLVLDSTQPFSLGEGILGNGGYNFPLFPGYACQVRYWNVARTAAQITAALNELLPADRAGLVAAWPLDETSGSTARDISGANRSLTTAAPDNTAPALQSGRFALLTAGAFFDVTTTPLTDDTLKYISDSALIDFDGDGDLDLVILQGYAPPTYPETRTRLRAFRNNRGTFVDATDAVLGNVTMAGPRHMFVGDFNRDGRPDLFVAEAGTDIAPFPGGQSKLFIQSADGRLVDETATRLPQRPSYTHNCAAADIDGDGDLDLYMGNVWGGDVGPRFYINNGSGFFTEATDRIPADIANRAPGSVFTSCLLLDVNRDGFPDLILGGADAPKNEILINDRTGHYVRDSRYTLPPRLFDPSGTSQTVSTVAISTADFNGDGAPDLLLCTTDGYTKSALQLLLNRGDGTFVDATSSAGLALPTLTAPQSSWAKWTRIVDLNGDGRPDIAVEISWSGGLAVRLFVNRGDATFVDVTDTYTRLGYGSGILQAGDFDRDGRMDLVTAGITGIEVSRNIQNMTFGRLANLSVRSQAGTGDQTLIAGFALGGGAGSKSLLVRAIGPTLSAFGVTGPLADPLLEVAPLGGVKVATNNGWGGTTALKNAFTSVGAFPLSPDTSKDSALVFSPTSGAYTASVTSASNTTGVALVEVYDAGTGNTPRLNNVSARSLVGTDADALIAGFVVNGTMPKKLLIRASGPSLATFGVGGTLVDPVLTVRPLGSDSVVATNDDWGGTAALKAAFASVGAFAFTLDTSKDAALVVELPAGAYTATVSGKNSTTGVALVEVYELP